MSDHGSPIPSPSSYTSSSRQRALPTQIVSDEDILQAVLVLWSRYHAPSTSLIVSHLANGNPCTRTLQNTVREALQRLAADDRLACLIHRGTQRWTPCHKRNPRSAVSRAATH